MPNVYLCLVVARCFRKVLTRARVPFRVRDRVRLIDATIASIKPSVANQTNKNTRCSAISCIERVEKQSRITFNVVFSLI